MVRILFVDDEPNILQGLRRTLHAAARDWDLRFALSGAEALQLLAEQPCDVIATDLQMPGMDGAALLSEVKRRWPSTLRIITSGSCEQGQVVKAVGTAHQYLSKPYDTGTLKQTIERSLRQRTLLGDSALARFVSGINHQPAAVAARPLSADHGRASGRFTVAAAGGRPDHRGRCSQRQGAAGGQLRLLRAVAARFPTSSCEFGPQPPATRPIYGLSSHRNGRSALTLHRLEKIPCMTNAVAIGVSIALGSVAAYHRSGTSYH